MKAFQIDQFTGSVMQKGYAMDILNSAIEIIDARIEAQDRRVKTKEENGHIVSAEKGKVKLYALIENKKSLIDFSGKKRISSKKIIESSQKVVVYDEKQIEIKGYAVDL